VSFSDAEYHAQEGVPLWLRDEAFAPLFLAAPKPASYATYLQQDPAKLPARDVAHKHEYVAALNKYSNGDAKLRGQKFYWHHVKKVGGQPAPLDYEDLKQGDGSDFKQRVKPLAAGNKFTFTVRFDNLTENELGALLWALNLPARSTCPARTSSEWGKPSAWAVLRLRSPNWNCLTFKPATNRLVRPVILKVNPAIISKLFAASCRPGWMSRILALTRVSATSE
jgi:hypothetical protein